jgi:hypothetical protein
MKILTSATFERYDIEHEEERMFIFFGPITRQAFTESYYLFKDSAKRYPDVIVRFEIPEGETFLQLQAENPVLIHEAGLIRIYGFKGLFVRCGTPEESVEMVRGIVWEKEEREAKRLERLRKRGSLDSEP